MEETTDLTILTEEEKTILKAREQARLNFIEKQILALDVQAKLQKQKRVENLNTQKVKLEQKIVEIENTISNIEENQDATI